MSGKMQHVNVAVSHQLGASPALQLTQHQQQLTVQHQQQQQQHADQQMLQQPNNNNDQQSSTNASGRNVQEQQQLQHVQIPMQQPQSQSKNCPTQQTLSPPQIALPYAPSPHTTQSQQQQAQGQVLQQIPQQPLFQQQGSDQQQSQAQQHVIISPQHQQHQQAAGVPGQQSQAQQNVIIAPQHQHQQHNHTVAQQLHQQQSQKHKQIQQQLPQYQQQQVHPTPSQQQQQQQQQPAMTTMLQTPILYSNETTNSAPPSATAIPTASTAAASNNRSKSPQKSTIKKGRFRVVKGTTAAQETTTAATQALEEAKVAAQQLAAMVTAQTTNNNNENSQSLAVKKGRFVVKKATVSAKLVVASVECEAATTENKSSPQQSSGNDRTSFAKRTSDEDVASNPVRREDDNASSSPAAAATYPSDVADAAKIPVAGTKKKGRFLVKTGLLQGQQGSSAKHLAAMGKPCAVPTQQAKAANTGASGGGVQPPKATTHNGPGQQPQNNTSRMGGSSVEEPGDNNKTTKGNNSARDVGLEQSGVANKLPMPAKCAADAATSTTKKKGRFVVKTGGNNSATSSPAARKTRLSSAQLSSAPPEGMQNSGIAVGNGQIFQLTPINPQLQNFSLAGMPTTSLVEVNGQVMCVSNVAALPLPQTIQHTQHHALHHFFPASQPTLVQASQMSQPANPLALNTVSGAESSSQLQHQPQQVQSQTQASPSFAVSLQPSSALLRPRAATEERAPDAASAKSNLPRANYQRSTSSSGSGRSLAGTSSRAPPPGCGKNGRLIGGGGAGKILHHLDTLRSEVVEADRFITSLQSDNRILRDKNKELEARNRELQQKLQTAESKCRSLIQKVKDQSIIDTTTAGQHNRQMTRPQGGAAAHQLDNHHSTPSADSRLENRGSASFDDLQPAIIENNSATIDHQPPSGHKHNSGNNTSHAPIKLSSSTTAKPVPQPLTGARAPCPATGQPTDSSKTLPISRNNSSDATSDDTKTRTQAAAAAGIPPLAAVGAHHLATSGHTSSIANQFDPLGDKASTSNPTTATAVHPSNNGLAAAQTCISTTMASTIHHDQSALIPSIVAAQSVADTCPPPPPPDIGDTPYTATNGDLRTKHFDPLGTPERSHVTPPTLVQAIVINGALPHMPAMPRVNNIDHDNHLTVPVIVPLIQNHHQQLQQQQQSRQQQEDPFDEIVRLSHSHGTM